MRFSVDLSETNVHLHSNVFYRASYPVYLDGPENHGLPAVAADAASTRRPPGSELSAAQLSVRPNVYSVSKKRK